MKVSKEQAAKNRETIVQVAAAQLRERGLAQLSVADVAKAAGLTHGALYSHFASKDALVAAALTRAYEETAAGFSGLGPEQLIRRYLSAEHRDDAGRGCPAAALLSEARCQSDAVQSAFTAGFEQFSRGVGESLGAGAGQTSKDQAVLTVAAMVGGLAIARALRETDIDASDAVLEAVTRELRRQMRVATQAPGRKPRRPKRQG